MRPRRSLWVGLLAAGVLVAAFLLFAPIQLGGSTIYTATVGNSMEPLFHKGDLALLRPARSYGVGDVVLYQSPVLQRPVLHRILVVQGDRYYFKGDHNDFVDPGYVTRDELLGKLWIEVPKAGVALSFIGKPAHAGLLAGVAALVLLLGGAKAEGRRRRDRRRSPGWTPPMKTPAFRHLRRPRRTPENILAGGALALGVLVLLIGFITPVAHTVPLSGAYGQNGSFSYSSTLSRPNSAYPDGIVRTGQPVFLIDFKTLKVDFAYRFTSKLAHSVTGTVGLKAVLSSASPSWSRTFTLEPSVAFRGDVARVSGTADLRQLRTLTHQLAIDTGTVVSQYDISLQPTVRVRGVVGGNRISEVFAPSLPFTLTDAVLALNVPAPAVMPGSSFNPPTTTDTNATALEPKVAGALPVRAPNAVTIVHVRLAVSLLRGLGLGLTGLALLTLLTKPLRRKRDSWSNEKRIAFRLGCVIVDVVSLESAVASTGVPTTVPDFESLANFARYLERPILRDTCDGTYATEDSGRLYVFRPAAPRETASPPFAAREPAPVVEASTIQPRPARRRRRRRTLASLLGVLTAVAIAVGLVTSFTAANTVPLTRAGVSKQPVEVMQLAPVYCSTLTLTNLVIATSNTATGTNADDLVLGRNATGTLKGLGGDDCIVAGGHTGTTNTIDGGAGTDVCIGAQGATNRFNNCEYSVTP